MVTRKRVSFDFKGKHFNVSARKCSIYSSGLMFRSRETLPCLFELKKTSNFKITSLFVSFSFLAVWLDGKNKVADFRVVKPFTLSISSKKPYKKLLEIPINTNNSKIIHSIVGKRKI